MNELKAVFDIINKCWHMFKDDAQNVGTDDEWMQDIVTKYNHFATEFLYGPMRGFALDMSKACVYELERLYKEQNGIGGPDDRWKEYGT